MPFDYHKYREKTNEMTTEQLQREWENYTRQISAGATSTATSILFMPVTGGMSVVGVGLSAPRIHNARKKREIIEAGLKARGTTHHTRTGDVLAPMAVSGIIGGLTLGLLPPGADSAAGIAAVRGVEIAAANTALNATEAVVVESARKKESNVANILDDNSQGRYGIMATPFLMDASVFLPPPAPNQGEQQVDQPTAQNHPTPNQPAIIAEADQSSIAGKIYVDPAPNPKTDRDRSLSPAFPSLSVQLPTDHREQIAHTQPQATASDAKALFESIPTSPNVAVSGTGDDDLFDPHTVEEEVLLALHALTLAMERQEEEKQMPNLAPHSLTQETATHKSQMEAPQFSIQNQIQPLGSIQEYQVQETTPPWLSNQVVHEQRPALPPRHGPRATTLPGNLYSPPHVSSINQDTQNYRYPPQPVPPYQPQFFSPSYQMAEPQQYNPPPLPPQQRQDSGYGSMHSIPSYSSAFQQTYEPPPNPISRHSSIPQTYPPPPASSFYPPQTQAQYGHRASESSLYPMTPPPPYFAPPPGTTTAPAAEKENDYFNQNAVPPPHTPQTQSTHSSFNPLLQRGQSLVDEMNKGWQWARANAPIKMPTDSKRINEPNYGPPPTVPNVWRGS